MRRMPFWLSVGFLTILSAFAPLPAAAQVAPGIQGGISLDDDFAQIFFGGHLETSPLVDRLRFRPGVDVGVGDDPTHVAFNLDFTYAFTSARPWNLYLGGGPAINWWNFDNGSDTDAGFNALVGAKNRDGWFFELRAGLVDSPAVKFGVGYTFR
jgi:hypothetical protein